MVILMMVLGWMSLNKMPVDLFPNVTFPIVMVNTPYPGAGPVEVETLISKVLEDEISTLPGIKSLKSINKEGVSTVIAEFTLETDIKYAESQIRDRIGSARRKLPADIKEPIIRRIDPADQPVLILSLKADLPEGELFDMAEEILKPKIEQVPQVGMVETVGGRKREIQVLLDRDKLRNYRISANQIATRIGAAGQNIPAGKVNELKREMVFRTLGEFKSLDDIKNTIINFLGDDVPVTVGNVGQVVDTLEDEKSQSFVNGKKALLLNVFRQSGSNTIAVVEAVKKRMEKINEEISILPGKPHMEIVRDGSKVIEANVLDVKESIFIGILLTIIVVYFFLGSGRSTFITGLAIPNSLIGAFLLMSLAGFSINIMSLLALSLSVGLLIDDAIVVRENIFRHMELGAKPKIAALTGTKEVTLAVVATTFAVLAVFGPIGFLQGVVGQFFKEFGLTICFAMAISLFDALTIAPMLSAYFAGDIHKAKKETGIWANTMGRALKGFDRFQTWLENLYEKTIVFTLKRPIFVLFSALIIFIFSLFLTKFIPKTFLPAQDTGEFSVGLEMSPGTNLASMSEVAKAVDKDIRANPEVATTVMFLGGRDGESNIASFFVTLVHAKQRNINTNEFKDKVRAQLKKYPVANPVIKDVDTIGGGQRAFNINIIGPDLKVIEDISNRLYAKLEHHPGLKDPKIGSQTGKPEFQVAIDNRKAEKLGVSSLVAGAELRTLVEGNTPAVFRESGKEYDIRVRLKEDQRNIGADFDKISVPNINFSLVKLPQIAKPVQTTGPATINRQDRGRYIQISADIAPKGPGMGGVMSDITRILEKEIKLPPGVRYAFVGQAENFKELGYSLGLAAGLGILFIYFVLASLYESFITPFTIMLVLPLAACGAFFALAITQSSLDIFSMIGCIMLLGIASKNSILLVDYTNQLVAEGMELNAAIIKAGKIRLRPILMTSIALIAGMLPIAIGLNEASKQRTSMGIAIIGGLISSTLLTLVVVPAAFSYIERFRNWSGGLVKKVVGAQE
ncbi:MAG: efflux RND transporter permease subunit [Bacteriovoracales bacterium]